MIGTKYIFIDYPRDARLLLVVEHITVNRHHSYPRGAYGLIQETNFKHKIIQINIQLHKYH